jgi:Hint domain
MAMSAMLPSSACFAKGTLITTIDGNIPIDELKPGSQVLTATRGYQSVRWIGWLKVDLSSLTEPLRRNNQPILIAASAVGKGIPYQDLTISARHAIVIGGSLVAAGNMVNGRNIVIVSDLQSITYYHLELDGFNIIFANGLPSESYVDVGNRYLFEHSVGHPPGHMVSFVNAKGERRQECFNTANEGQFGLRCLKMNDIA